MQKYFAIFFTILILCGCRNNKFYINEIKIKNGDLLFQQSINTNLEQAISSVTSSYKDPYNFTHVGIVYKKNIVFFVIEAAPEKVRMVPIEKFLLGDSAIESRLPITIPARLKPQYRHLINPALANATKYLGKDYDYAYLPDNDKYYCSELIYLIFKEANNNIPIFEAKPMTFKVYDSINDSYNYSPFWIEHYKSLNTAIPEGQLGTNPADMAKSNVIELLQ